MLILHSLTIGLNFTPSIFIKLKLFFSADLISFFGSTNFSKYDVIIIPNGYYGRVLNKRNLEKLKTWVRSGGTLITIGSALNSFADKKEFSLKRKKSEEKNDEANLVPFSERERKGVENMITGSIFSSVLKLSGSSYEYLKNGNNVAYFNSETKNISGFAGQKALEKVPESLLFGEEQIGRGSIIYMVDNPLFRSFWENGKLFMANAVFLLNSDTIK